MSINTLAFVALAGIGCVWLWMKIGKFGIQLIGVLLLIALAGSFVFLHTLSTSDQVATVKCSEATNTPHTMIVQMNGTTHEIGGDMWMLQSSTIEVQSYMYWLGVKSAHTLTRLDSEYSDPNHDTAKPVDLGGVHFENFQALLMLPIVRSSYQSAVSEPCDGRAYTVVSDVNGDLSAQRA